METWTTPCRVPQRRRLCDMMVCLIGMHVRYDTLSSPHFGGRQREGIRSLFIWFFSFAKKMVDKINVYAVGGGFNARSAHE